jgi:uncharacterized protein (TIGR03435 family)
VLDQTGLNSRYDFDFDLSGYRTGGPASGDPPQDPVAVMQAELPRQLGLKLEAHKLPVQMFVIDQIQTKPVEN